MSWISIVPDVFELYPRKVQETMPKVSRPCCLAAASTHGLCRWRVQGLSSFPVPNRWAVRAGTSPVRSTTECPKSSSGSDSAGSCRHPYRRARWCGLSKRAQTCPCSSSSSAQRGSHTYSRATGCARRGTRGDGRARETALVTKGIEADARQTSLDVDHANTVAPLGCALCGGREGERV
jgi:hypothetical protein